MCAVSESDLKGITSVVKGRSSTLYTLREENRIDTSYGTYIPQYSDEDYGRKKYNGSLSLYHSGNVRSIALDKISEIETSVGTVPAEMIMFYESGALEKVFPLNGMITAFWTEEDEGELCPVLTVPLRFGTISAKLINISFYESGSVKSVTLWPGEKAEVDTPVGKVKVRIGVSLHEDGSICSLEPAEVLLLETPIGKISAFDMLALGINADDGSVIFSPDGEILSLKTIDNRVKVVHNGETEIFSPLTRPAMTAESGTETDALTITFGKDSIILDNGKVHKFPIEGSKFIVERYIHTDILTINDIK
jgi:hypothetical protein